MAKEKFNISFKKYPKQTGLSAIGYPNRSTDILLNKCRIGLISAPNWQTHDNLWRVSISVMKTEEDLPENCPWKRIYFKNKFKSEPEARVWVKENIKEINKKYTIFRNTDKD